MMKATTTIKYTLQLDLTYNVLFLGRGGGNGEETLVQLSVQNKLLLPRAREKLAIVTFQKY